MSNHYQIIDNGILSHYRKLEQQGLPLDLSELNLKIFKKSQELARMKESLNQKFGSIPVFSDGETWNRIFIKTTGYNIPRFGFSGKISLSRKTVEELKEVCPELVDLYRGLQIDRLVSQMTKVESVKIEDQDKYFLKPRYKIDPISGQIFLRDPNLRTWGKDLKGVVRESGYNFLLVWYDALDLMVLQDFTQDPVLESDLTSGDPPYNMACRFWETGNPNQEQIFIARMAFHLFCNGVKADRFWYSINTTYSDRCSLTEEESCKLYTKFINHYTVSCEYFDRVSRLPVAPRSLFGRCGVGRDNRTYSVASTTTDITKLGFLSVLEDSRLEKLGVKPLALVSFKMLLAIPCERDLLQVGEYLWEDLSGAYPRYNLKACISKGSSWGECEVAGDPSQETEP